MYAHEVAGKVKLATKKKYVNPTWFAVCAEIIQLHEALESLKTGIVKRQVRPEEERAEDYVPPIPNNKIAKLVYGALKAMTDPLTMTFADQLYVGYVEGVEYEIAHPIIRGSEKWNGHMRHGIPTHHALMSNVGGEFDSAQGIYLNLVPDYKGILRKVADKNADFVQRVYLYKNVSKLAVIIERKNNLAGNPEILTAGIMPGGQGFHGEVRFNFTDGSSFVVRNKVVYKTSFHGRNFAQYPTTFHHVTMPDGKAMSQPSEERMNEVFAKCN